VSTTLRVRSVRTNGKVHLVAERRGGNYTTACGVSGQQYPFGWFVALIREPDAPVTCGSCLREQAREHKEGSR